MEKIYKHHDSPLSWAIQKQETGFRVEVFDKEYYEGGSRSTRSYYYFFPFTQATTVTAALLVALKDVRTHSVHPTMVQRAIDAQYRSSTNQLSLDFG